MFEEFTKKKFNQYLDLVQFPGEKINILKLRNYKLPPFIINFFECSYPKNTTLISKAEFGRALKKAIIFNINYIIKPKATILKFIFGDVETRPAEYVKQKLDYFQFYNYYISHIENFINLNSPLVISLDQIKHLIDEINNKILEEIINPLSDDTQRLNLIKLIYYYFLELTENNPINIKLPKKILSVFFSDKGYKEIKSRIDGFFSDEIFIQEAIQLMKPVKKDKKSDTSINNEGLDEKSLKEFVDKAKTSLLNTDSSNKDIQQALQIELNVGESTLNTISNISDLRSENINKVELLDKDVTLDEKIYSEDLAFESQLNEAFKPEPLTEKENKIKLLKEIFCEESFRKKIIKKLFQKDGKVFQVIVLKILESADWKEASAKIADYYDNNKIKYYKPEAVKFVDLLESYFLKDNIQDNNLKQGYQKS
jgi:hypothetical protein